MEIPAVVVILAEIVLGVLAVWATIHIIVISGRMKKMMKALEDAEAHRAFVLNKMLKALTDLDANSRNIALGVEQVQTALSAATE